MPCPVCPSCAGGFPKAAPPSVHILKEGDPVYKSEKRLYLTQDRTRAVEEGDPEAAFLLVAEGGEMQDAEAERLGLTGKRKGAAPEPNVVHSIAADPEPEPKSKPARTAREADDHDEGPAEGNREDDTEGKAVSGPAENKARGKAESK